MFINLHLKTKILILFIYSDQSKEIEFILSSIFMYLQDYTIHHQYSDAHRDEGFVVTETMDILRNLTPNEEIYISLYATNKVSCIMIVVRIVFTSVTKKCTIFLAVLFETF